MTVPGDPSRFPTVDPMTLLPLLPPGSALGEALRPLPSLSVPWDQLAMVDGWSAWLGHPPVIAALDLLPLPEPLVWGDPVTVIGATVATALAYAAIRGATSFVSSAAVMRREGPLSIVVPGDISPTLAVMLAECTALGIPTVSGGEDVGRRLAELAPRRHRAAAHAALPGTAHDPALSAEQVAVARTVGDNSLSSFVLHNEGERDGVTITGEPGDRFGVEIGIRGDDIDLALSRLVEADAARMPGFLPGVTSEPDGTSIRVGLSEGVSFDPEATAAVWAAWLREVWGATLVDIRIAFAPDHGRSALLVDMRTRAREYRAWRAEQLGTEDHWADSGYGGAVS
jgi:hypothetical protein